MNWIESYHDAILYAVPQSVCVCMSVCRSLFCWLHLKFDKAKNFVPHSSLQKIRRSFCLLYWLMGLVIWDLAKPISNFNPIQIFTEFYIKGINFCLYFVFLLLVAFPSFCSLVSGISVFYLFIFILLILYIIFEDIRQFNFFSLIQIIYCKSEWVSV